MILDYCTILVDKNEWELLPLHLNSLRHYSPGVSFNFKISVPDDDPETIEYCKGFPVEVMPLPIFKQNIRNCLNQASFDCANRLDKLIKSCTSDWVVVSHADIVYTGSLIDSISPILAPDVGMINYWPLGVTVINRKIYNECHFGFWPITNLRTTNNDDPLRLCNYTEAGDSSRLIIGIDVGALLKLEMQGYGHRFVLSNLMHSYQHIGEQSRYWLYLSGSDDIKERKRLEIEQKKQKALEEFKRFK